MPPVTEGAGDHDKTHWLVLRQRVRAPQFLRASLHLALLGQQLPRLRHLQKIPHPPIAAQASLARDIFRRGLCNRLQRGALLGSESRPSRDASVQLAQCFFAQAGTIFRPHYAFDAGQEENPALGMARFHGNGRGVRHTWTRCCMLELDDRGDAIAAR